MSTRPSVAWAAVCAVSAGAFVFMLAPIAVVLVEAFDDGELMSFPPQSLSLRWFAAFFDNPEFMASLWLSLWLAVVAAAVATACGTLAGVAIARSKAAGMQTVLMAPLYVPRVLVGLALLLAFAGLDLSGSVAGLLLGHVLITLPYATRTVAVGIGAVEPAVQEAARVLGATPAQVFRMVTLPIIRTTMLSGFVFALIVSFSDIYLALFIAGPQTVTLPMRLYTFMEWDQSPVVAAASAVQVALVLAVVLVTGRAFGVSGAERAR